METTQIPTATYVGVQARMSNADPNIIEVIGNLWKNFHALGIAAKYSNRSDQTFYAIYYNYESDYTGMYDLLVGIKIDDSNQHIQYDSVTVPNQEYIHHSKSGGETFQMVVELWEQVWGSHYPRSYSYDIESYLPDGSVSVDIAILQ